MEKIGLLLKSYQQHTGQSSASIDMSSTNQLKSSIAHSTLAQLAWLTRRDAEIISSTCMYLRQLIWTAAVDGKNLHKNWSWTRSGMQSVRYEASTRLKVDSLKSAIFHASLLCPLKCYSRCDRKWSLPWRWLHRHLTNNRRVSVKDRHDGVAYYQGSRREEAKKVFA